MAVPTYFPRVNHLIFVLFADRTLHLIPHPLPLPAVRVIVSMPLPTNPALLKLAVAHIMQRLQRPLDHRLGQDSVNAVHNGGEVGQATHWPVTVAWVTPNRSSISWRMS